MDKPKMYGFTSAKSRAAGYATVFWSTPDGGEVEVDFVFEDQSGKDYGWDDKVCVGEVVDYSRPGQAKNRKPEDNIPNLHKRPGRWGWFKS